VVRLKSGNESQPRLGAKVFNKGLNGGLMEHGHEEQGAQHNRRIIASSAARIVGIESIERRGERIEVEVEQH